MQTYSCYSSLIKHEIYPSGIILHKHNTDNQAVTYNFNLILKGDQYIIAR